MKVYIVTSGSYSDYGIICCFSNEEDAKELSEKLSDGSYEEYEIDNTDITEVKGKRRYIVEMKFNGDSEVNDAAPSSFDAGDIETNTSQHDDLLCVYCWAESEYHAVKIANEHRTRIIAANEWKTRD